MGSSDKLAGLRMFITPLMRIGWKSPPRPALAAIVLASANSSHCLATMPERRPGDIVLSLR